MFFLKIFWKKILLTLGFRQKDHRRILKSQIFSTFIFWSIFAHNNTDLSRPLVNEFLLALVNPATSCAPSPGCLLVASWSWPRQSDTRVRALNTSAILSQLPMMCHWHQTMPGQLGWWPLPGDAGGPRGPGLYHGVAPVTLEHDLPRVLDLPDVGPVLVQTHVANEQDLAVLDKPGEGAVNWN